jgi:hypothetical protein
MPQFAEACFLASILRSVMWDNPTRRFGPLRPVTFFVYGRLADNLPFFPRCVAFTSYGAFWLSFATILIPNSGISDAYGADPGMEADAIGIYLMSWMAVTFFFL